MRRPLALATVLALLGAACGGEPADAGDPGATGAVTADAAEGAVLGLCEIRDASEVDPASATFQDRSHRFLHDLAAAVEPVDRGAAADLFTSKQRVEADLAEASLPPSFAEDVEALLAATRSALGVVGVDPLACPA